MESVKMERVLARRPEQAIKKLGAESRVCLLNSRDIFTVLRDKEVIVMACNIRIRHVIPGIMRAAQELDAVVGFELARSEGDLTGGYTGQTPEIFFQTVVEYAEQRGFDRPFFIHGDHITVKEPSDEAVEAARELIAGEMEAGYTSFAIDASFNELEQNIRITSELAKPIIDEGLGLEVEVGEIKPAGKEAQLTTVEEATTFISGLVSRGIHPNLLAVNNGSKHGNYLDGEKVHIDLDRTRQIYQAVRDYGVSIAQHGITGTPMSIVGRFAEYGIRKGNVGTEWQNIAHRGLPQDLMDAMRRWAEEHGKDIKFATREFKSQIDDIDEPYKKAIEDEAYRQACAFFKAFKSPGTGTIVLEALSH